MHNPHSRTIKKIENRSKQAFAVFNASVLTDAAVETPRPGSRAKLATALKNAATRPDVGFERAAATLKSEVDGVARDWDAIENDCHRWKSVAAVLRGEDEDIDEPALAAAAEVLKQSPQAASLAREIISAIEPVLEAVSASKSRHVTATKIAQRHVVHKGGIKVYEALGDSRKAMAHSLMLERTEREAAARRAAVRAGVKTNGR